MLKDGVNDFGVGAMKDVYRQMQQNLYTEICGLLDGGKLFIRYCGQDVFAKGAAGDPVMKKICTPASAHRSAAFHLAEATCEKRAMTAISETLRNAAI